MLNLEELKQSERRYALEDLRNEIFHLKHMLTVKEKALEAEPIEGVPPQPKPTRTELALIRKALDRAKNLYQRVKGNDG